MSAVVEHYWVLRFDSFLIDWEEVWVYANGVREKTLHLNEVARRGLGLYV